MTWQPTNPAEGNSGRSHLSDRDREALHLADELRTRLWEWMSRRGVDGMLFVTPYVDPSGQPSVLVRINSHLARALLLSLEAQPVQPPPQRGDHGTLPGHP